MKSIDELRDFVRQRLSETSDPNKINYEIDETVKEMIQAWAKENGWSLWGTGDWYIDTASACSICGSCLPGGCGHDKDPKQVVLRGIEAVKRSRET
jgi:hypothetical protein